MELPSTALKSRSWTSSHLILHWRNDKDYAYLSYRRFQVDVGRGGDGGAQARLYRRDGRGHLVAG